MEGYCVQCIHTDREKQHKEFVNYQIMIHCKKLNSDVNCYGKEECFEENINWQHLNECDCDLCKMCKLTQEGAAIAKLHDEMLDNGLL